MIDVGSRLAASLPLQPSYLENDGQQHQRNKWTKRAETGNVGDRLGKDDINAT